MEKLPNQISMRNSDYIDFDANNGQQSKLKNISEEDQNDDEASKQVNKVLPKSNEPIALPATKMSRSEIKKTMNKK